MMSARNGGQTSTLLTDGRVLVTGGGGSTPEIYDPAKGTWSATSPIATSAGETATLLRDGRVLVAGGLGTDNVNAIAAAEVFDPATNLWSTTAPMSEIRLSAQAARLADGRVVVFGGSTTGSGGTFRASTEIYDPGMP
jgi:N-acetylneuraminic acid mutarotase